MSYNNSSIFEAISNICEEEKKKIVKAAETADATICCEDGANVLSEDKKLYEDLCSLQDCFKPIVLPSEIDDFRASNVMGICLEFSNGNTLQVEEFLKGKNDAVDKWINRYFEVPVAATTMFANELHASLLFPLGFEENLFKTQEEYEEYLADFYNEYYGYTVELGEDGVRKPYPHETWSFNDEKGKMMPNPDGEVNSYYKDHVLKAQDLGGPEATGNLDDDNDDFDDDFDDFEHDTENKKKKIIPTPFKLPKRHRIKKKVDVKGFFKDIPRSLREFKANISKPETWSLIKKVALRLVLVAGAVALTAWLAPQVVSLIAGLFKFAGFLPEIATVAITGSGTNALGVAYTAAEIEKFREILNGLMLALGISLSAVLIKVRSSRKKKKLLAQQETDDLEQDLDTEAEDLGEDGPKPAEDLASKPIPALYMDLKRNAKDYADVEANIAEKEKQLADYKKLSIATDGDSVMQNLEQTIKLLKNKLERIKNERDQIMEILLSIDPSQQQLQTQMTAAPAMGGV